MSEDPGDGASGPEQLALFGRPDGPASGGWRLSDAAAAYLVRLGSIGRSVHSLKAVRLDLEGLARHLTDPPLAAVTTEQLRGYVARLNVQDGLAAGSVTRKIASIKGLFRHATAERWVARDPAAPLVYPRARRGLPVFLEQPEVDRLVLAASRNPFWEAVVLVLADAGLKSDELLALEPADLYLDDRSAERSYLVVRRTREAKRLRARTLALTPRLRSALRRCLDEQGTGSGPLFAVTPRGVNSMLESLTGLAGLRRLGRVTPEMLRASFAVGQVRRRLAAEAAAAASGRPETERRALRAQHDLELHELLGLSADDPERVAQVARKYRHLAAPAGR
ncbi:MAG TPA: site-specific integrase [Chloroflexota bacterium]|jgi:site-specific recombinase XerD